MQNPGAPTSLKPGERNEDIAKYQPQVNDRPPSSKAEISNFGGGKELFLWHLSILVLVPAHRKMAGEKHRPIRNLP